MAHLWADESRPIHPGTVKEGYLVKSPPLNKKGIQYKVSVEESWLHGRLAGLAAATWRAGRLYCPWRMAGDV